MVVLFPALWPKLACLVLIPHIHPATPSLWLVGQEARVTHHPPCGLHRGRLMTCWPQSNTDATAWSVMTDLSSAQPLVLQRLVYTRSNDMSLDYKNTSMDSRYTYCTSFFFYYSFFIILCCLFIELLVTPYSEPALSVTYYLYNKDITVVTVITWRGLVGWNHLNFYNGNTPFCYRVPLYVLRVVALTTRPPQLGKS